MKNTPLPVSLSTSPRRDPDLWVGIDKSSPFRHESFASTVPKARRAANNILYRFCTRCLLFEAFDDFSDFVESISCETSKSCQVRGSNPCRGATLSHVRTDVPELRTFGTKRTLCWNPPGISGSSWLISPSPSAGKTSSTGASNMQPNIPAHHGAGRPAPLCSARPGPVLHTKKPGNHAGARSA